MTKLLNIDTIAPLENRSITLNGKTYKVSETTVKLFLEIAEFEKQNANVETLQDQIKAMTTLISKFIPDLPEEVLMGATIEQLGTIVRFIRNDIPDEELEGSVKPQESSEATEEAQVEGK